MHELAYTHTRTVPNELGERRTVRHSTVLMPLRCEHISIIRFTLFDPVFGVERSGYGNESDTHTHDTNDAITCEDARVPLVCVALESFHPSMKLCAR